MALRIVIVDDHEVVRLGLRALLDRQPDFTVIGEAATVKEAVQKTLLLRPDVVVMDIRLLGGSGIDACRKIIEQAPDIKVIMLTSYAEDEMLFDAIAAGACGYVLKQIGSDELIRAVEAVGRGEALLDPALTQRVFARVREATRYINRLRAQGRMYGIKIPSSALKNRQACLAWLAGLDNRHLAKRLELLWIGFEAARTQT